MSTGAEPSSMATRPERDQHRDGDTARPTRRPPISACASRNASIGSMRAARRAGIITENRVINVPIRIGR